MVDADHRRILPIVSTVTIPTEPQRQNVGLSHEYSGWGQFSTPINPSTGSISHADSHVADEAAYEKKLQATREYFRPDMEVLEFGCGTGSTAIAHAPYVKHIHAIDISSKMIEIAQAKADAENVDNVTFEQSTVEELSVLDQSLDAVLGFSILHLLDNKEEVIARAHQMLKPGGIFVTSTMCLGDSMKFFKVIVPIGRFLGLMPLVKVFTARELAGSLTDAGFEIDYQWQPGKDKAVFIVAKKPK